MRLPPLLRLPATPRFRRPVDLAYAANELPPPLALGGLVVQHSISALALIAYVLVMAQMAGMDTLSTQSLVTATILAMATATFLQSWGGPLGSSLLLVSIPNPIMVVTGSLILVRYGVAGLATAGLVHGLVALSSGYLVPRLRTVLTPPVAGVVVCVAGLTLVEPGLRQITGVQAQGLPDAATLSIGAATLLTIVILSIWGSTRGKLYALLAGVLVGLVLAAVLGHLDTSHGIDAMPLLALPALPGFDAHVDIGVLLAVALLSLMAQLDTFGCVVLMHKMNDADWRRPDMRMVAGGMRANGLGDICGALFGALSTGLSSANIALCHISRSTARIIGLLTGLLLAACAFLPKATLALTLIPAPILGAIGLYAAAYLIVSGIELIASRAMDARAIFMVGLAFIAGIGVMMMPQLAQAAPAALQFAAGNAIVVAGVVAIALNLVFRIGSARQAVQALGAAAGAADGQRLVDFVESQGARWNARREIVARAAAACLEAGEAVQAAGPGRQLLEIRGTFDEYNLDLELRHDGAPLVLQAGAAAAPATLPADLLDRDDDEAQALMDQALNQLSHLLLRNLADRVSSGKDDQSSWLRLHFDH